MSFWPSWVFTLTQTKVLRECFFILRFFCLVQLEFAHSSRRYAPEWLVERKRRREQRVRSRVTLNSGVLGVEIESTRACITVLLHRDRVREREESERERARTRARASKLEQFLSCLS